MKRVLSQTTLKQLKKAKLKKFWKLLLNLKTDNCEYVMISLVEGIIADINQRQGRKVHMNR